MGTPLHDAVQSVAAAQGLDPKLLEAICLVESGGRPDSLRFELNFYNEYIKGKPSVAGAKYGPLAAASFGVMQILLETACELGFTGEPWDLFQLQTGLAWGAKDLKRIVEWADGNQDRAILAYNSGMGHVEMAPPYADQAYLSRVQAALKGL
jgi:soluble lytic murein transglycosylase-like protein